MIIKVEFEVKLPDFQHTEKHLEDFLRYEFKDNNLLEGNNIFNVKRTSAEPIFGTFEWDYIEIDETIIKSEDEE